jgi:hypothetical protein
MFSSGTPLSSFSARRQAVLRGPTLDADPLAGVHPGIQAVLWSWLVRAIDESLWEIAGLFPPSSPALEPPEQHGPPPFPAGYLCPRPLDGLRRLLRGEARLSIEALEILVLSRVPQPRVEQALTAHCARIGQLYLEMQRRLGVGVALPLLVWELRLLRHRGSPVAAPLAFGPLPAQG